MKIDHCRSCNAEIVWAITEKGKHMPVDKDPSRKGNIMLVWRTNDEKPLAIYLNEAQIDAFKGSLQAHRMHLSHFSTCKDADKWRKR